MYTPQIFILPEFAATFEKKNTSQRILNAVNKEIKRLKAISKDGILFEYLKNQNGKKLKGHPHQFKYRMNSGDRIFYTYGQYIRGTKPEEESAIFIYAYSKHDNQDRQIIPEYEEPENVTDEDFKKGYFNNSGFKNAADVDNFFEKFPEWKKDHSAYVMTNMNISNSVDELDVYLSTEQDKIVNDYFINNKPLLILGGAGTGKTIMALHIMHDFKAQNPSSRCIYFTQSEALLRRANNKYKYIVNTSTDSSLNSIMDKVEFQNINDFCIDFYNKKNTNKITYSSQFSGFDFFNYASDEKLNILNRNNTNVKINKYDLWAEIRGTIKGGLNIKWQRPHVFNTTDFNNDFISELLEHKLINKNQKLFEITDFSKMKNYLTNYSDGQDSRFIDLLLKNCEEVDHDTKLIAEKDYLEKDEQNSTLPQELRKHLYDFTLNYQEYLNANNLYDDNDLVMKLLSCPIDEDDKYDFIVIDEIQDYTELQIYAILKFAKNYNSIIMSGDSHQIINPTIFNESRLSQFFYNNEHQLVIKELHRNFRCPQEIVKIANKSTSLSRKMIAATSANVEEKSEFHSNTYPFLLENKEDNVVKLAKTLIKYPNTVILVPDENTKSELINKVGKLEYEEAKNPIINTVAEIKGMEYKYVVTYNVLSTFRKQWNDIFDGTTRRQTRYRYYFNLFYVAITRSQQYLCLIESQESQLINEIKDNLKQIANTDENALYINKLTHDADDWFDMARKEYDNGNYRKALITLDKIPEYKSSDKTNLINKCNMYIAHEEKDYEKCLKYALLLNEVQTIAQNVNKAAISKEFQYLLSVIQNPSKLVDKKQLINNIKTLFPKHDEQKIIMNNFISNFGNYIFNTSINMDINQLLSTEEEK